MTNQVKEDSVPSLRMVDIVFAIICIAFSIFLMIGSVRLGAKWTPEGPESGYFPFYIFLMMLIASSVTLYEAIVINKKKPREDFVEKHAFQQILCICHFYDLDWKILLLESNASWPICWSHLISHV